MFVSVIKPLRPALPKPFALAQIRVVIRLCLAGAMLIGCGLGTEAKADPREYCDAFARQAANDKTGEAAVGNVGVGQKWQDAYGREFSACIANYASEQAPADAKRSEPHRKSPGSHAAGNSGKGKLARGRASGGLKKSRPLAQAPNSTSPARNAKFLCRHLKVTARGGYRIENCKGR